VIAFDADPRGRASTRTLAHELRRTGHGPVHELDFPGNITDLNQWASLEPATFHELVASRVQEVSSPATLAVVRGAISR
jgi:hypothetical protein